VPWYLVRVCDIQQRSAELTPPVPEVS